MTLVRPLLLPPSVLSCSAGVSLLLLLLLLMTNAAGLQCIRLFISLAGDCHGHAVMLCTLVAPALAMHGV